MSFTVRPSQTFDPKTITFSKVAFNQRGGQNVYLNVDGDKQVYLCAPYMYAPFGLNVQRDEGKTNVSLTLSFKGEDSNEDLKKTHQVLKELDAIVLATATSDECAEAWFGAAKNGKKRSSDAIRDQYNPICKEHKEGKYSDNLKLTIPLDKEGVPDVGMFDQQGKKITFSSVDDLSLLVNKQSYVQPVFHVSMVYFISRSMWGVSTKLTGFRYMAPKTRPSSNYDLFGAADALKSPAGTSGHEEEVFEEEELGEEEEEVEYVEEDEEPEAKRPKV